MCLISALQIQFERIDGLNITFSIKINTIWYLIPDLIFEKNGWA